ncbi:hypothetical protein EW026_g8031, partial [Hermanssonia centrifuga]
TSLPGLSADRQDTIQELLWESAAANLRKKEWIERKKKERLDKKSARHDTTNRGSPRNHPYGGISKAAGKKKAGRRTDFECRSEAGRSNNYVDDRLAGYFDPPILSSPSSGSGSYTNDLPALTLSVIAPGPPALNSPILPTPAAASAETPADSSSTALTATTSGPAEPAFVQGRSTDGNARAPDREREDEDDFDLDRMFEDYA